MYGPIRFLSAGESHGPKLTVIIEGFPAGLKLNAKQLHLEQLKRQKGFGRSARMKMESDQLCLSAGISQGHTTGAPIAIEINNADHKNWLNQDIPAMTAPRPGHADLTGALKYGHNDLRLSLERSSARETAMRVAVGSLCKQLLACFGISIGGYVISIGTISSEPSLSILAEEYERRIVHAQNNEFSFIDSNKCESVHQEIFNCMRKKDTLGGVIEVVALHVPVGLGSYAHFDRRLEARLGHALLSIPAIKGVSLGNAFDDAHKFGTEVHDDIFLDKDGSLSRKSNSAAGFEGGISTGLPIVARAAMKPISTTLTPKNSVNLVEKIPCLADYERSDFCAVTRAVVVCESMLALVIANALVEKIGGDSISEMQPRFAQLAKSHLDSIKIDGKTRQYNYDL